MPLFSLSLRLLSPAVSWFPPAPKTPASFSWSLYPFLRDLPFSLRSQSPCLCLCPLQASVPPLCASVLHQLPPAFRIYSCHSLDLCPSLSSLMFSDNLPPVSFPPLLSLSPLCLCNFYFLSSLPGSPSPPCLFHPLLSLRTCLGLAPCPSFTVPLSLSLNLYPFLSSPHHPF